MNGKKHKAQAYKATKSKEVDDIEDKLSWCESEPELAALSDSDSEIDISDSKS